LQQFGATMRYHTLAECAFRIGRLRVTSRYLNHPALTLGYRLETGSVTVVYATDHEPHMPYPPAVSARARKGPHGPKSGHTDAPISTPTPRTRSVRLSRQESPGWLAHREEQGHIAFLAGADLVIHDAQYSMAEYQQRLGWGHSPVEYV